MLKPPLVSPWLDLWILTKGLETGILWFHSFDIKHLQQAGAKLYQALQQYLLTYPFINGVCHPPPLWVYSYILMKYSVKQAPL